MPAVRDLEEYAVTSQEVWRSVHPDDSWLKLDWNESTHPLTAARRRVAEFLRHPGALSWYPDVEALELSKAIADREGLSPLEVLAFGGSDVALEAVARTYVGAGDVVLLAHPGYDNFRVYAAAAGGRCLRMSTAPDSRSFSLDHLLNQVRESQTPPRLVYLINPNNPVGYLIRREEVSSLATSLPETLIVVDEAYVEFAPAGSSAAPLIHRHPNLLISRSFSKAYGLAGLRCGYLLAARQLLGPIRKVRNGKNLSMMAQVAALAVLEDQHGLTRHVDMVCEGRQWFLDRYRSNGGAALESHGNFLLLFVPKPQDVINELRREKILVRDRSRIDGLEGGVRISVGYRNEMERVMAAFDQMPPAFWQFAP